MSLESMVAIWPITWAFGHVGICLAEVEMVGALLSTADDRIASDEDRSEEMSRNFTVDGAVSICVIAWK